MSTAIAKNFQVGSDGTATNNFTIRQPATPDGTVRIANGNSGTTTDLVTVTSAGNVGVGTTSPSDILTLAGGASGSYGLTINNAKVGGGTKAIFQYDATNQIALVGGNTTNGLAFQTLTSGSLTTKATLDSSGNLGLGVTPSAWSLGKAIEVGNPGNSIFGVAASQLTITQNAYYNAAYKYGSTAAASRYDQAAGQHIWYTAPSGTAGNAISFTQAMTLDASGRLGIGETSPDQMLVVKSGSAAASYIKINAPSYDTAIIGVDSSVFRIESSSTSPIAFRINGSERARISAAGGFSVGTTSDPGAGAIYATGNITAYFSDNRLKTRLGGIENALDKVEKLSGFYYEANETAQALGYKPKREVGVSAQEVQAVLPEVVSPAPVDQQYLTVDYERLVPLLIEAIKELRAEVRALKGI